MGDFVGWGQSGLETAYRKWNPAIAKFTVYAWYWVRYEIQCGLAQWKGYHRNSPEYAKSATFEEFNEEATYQDLRTPEESTYRELRQIVLLLPQDLYFVIVFRFYYELNNKEIEAITGIPSKQISAMVFTAIEMLREKYNMRERKQVGSQSP